MSNRITFFSLLLASVLLLTSCSKDDDAIQNQAFNIDFSSVTIGSVAVEVSGLNPNDQVLSSGLVWGETETPAIETNNFVLKSVISGTFQDTIYGLLKNTAYNFRAFQQTANGVDYGSVFLVETSATCVGETFQGNVFLGSQKEVDDFDVSNICSINGSFELTSENLLDPIIDISKFSNVSQVNTLQIYNNRELKSIVGLQNIETVSEFIYIGDNRELLTISPLSSLSGTVEAISIVDNEKLIDLNGLNGVRVVGSDANGGLEIRDNYSLESLGSFDTLEQLGNFTLTSNPALVSFEFPNLEGSLEQLAIEENGSLVSVASLGTLDDINYISIDGCLLLENLDGLNSVAKVGFMQISNSSLTNLDFLSNLSEGEQAFIDSNGELSDFCGLQGVIQSGGFIDFNANGNAYNPTRNDIVNGNCSL